MNIHEYIYGKLQGGAIPEELAVDLLCQIDQLPESKFRVELKTTDDQVASDMECIGNALKGNCRTPYARQEVEVGAEEGLGHWIFAEEWQEGALDRADKSIRTIVVLLSDGANQSKLVGAFAKINANVKVVFIEQAAGLGVETEKASCRYEVKRQVVESYCAVFGEIRRTHGEIDAVWYGWGLEDRSCIEDQGPIIYLLQGLARCGLGTKVWLVGEYRSSLERCYFESWVGYSRSIGRAMPSIRVAVVQADWAESVSTEPSLDSVRMERWARRLWDELQAKRMENSLYIGEQRYVLRIRPIEAATDIKRGVLRAGGTYLITGGLGGLGRLFAEYLAKRYSANLVLTGRSPVDEERRSRLKTLEDLGGQALYVAADVSDIEQMRIALKQGRERFGELHGVIHAAGIESGDSVLSRSIQNIEAVLEPKVRGTRVLSELLKGQESLDYICYFSSTSAVLGDFGSCDYAVGNRFQLAYAKYAEKGALAICWPLWADGGMGFKDDEASHLYLKTSGQRALGATDGIELFEQLLAQHRAHGLTHAMTVVGERDRIHTLLDSIAPVEAEGAMQVRMERRLELQGLTLSECVLWDLREIGKELLKLPREKLDDEENLAEYGFDSILLMQLAKRLSVHYEIEVLPSIFFSYATLQKLADYFMTEHTAAVQQLYGNEDTVKRVSAPRAAAQNAFFSKSADLRASQSASRLSLNPQQTQSSTPVNLSEPIAIVGMSGRFPGARNVEELWQILVEGREAVQEIPFERFDWREYYAELREDQGGASLSGKITSKWLGVMPGVDEFDPLFFEISPKEAQLMDPRQRLLLQESFKALEDAGYGASQLNAQKIGMFVGVEQGDYQILLANSGAEGSVTANHDAILAARLSYFLNLRGPAMAINTACSSGLVAAHQACLSLRAGECDAAIAASVNLILTPHGYVGMSNAGMLSPDGKCYAFDRRANGMVPGEAVVAVVLKRLSNAEKDGDLILAVIRGSGINYDGKTNGLTAPSGTAQMELIKEVYAKAHIHPRDIEYIVTHGTGTRLGDPVEINALAEAFKQAQSAEPFCALTSTKTNLGHTFAASGLVSLVSLMQALRYEMIPASLHCEQLSDYIDWKRSPFYVNTRNKPWPKLKDKPRLGAVSAFGMSGTNAHMVVAGYEQTTTEIQAPAPYYLIALSAKTEPALRQRAQDLIEVLQDPRQSWDKAALGALSHTLLHHRQHFSNRCALVAEGAEQAISLLQKIAADEKHPALLAGKVSAAQAQKRGGETPIARYTLSLIEALREHSVDAKECRENLCALGDLYCQGYDVPWDSLFAKTPQRRSLPTYSFARERHWMKSLSASTRASTQLGIEEQLNMKDTWYPEKHTEAEFGATPSTPKKIQLSSLEFAEGTQAPAVASRSRGNETTTSHPPIAKLAHNAQSARTNPSTGEARVTAIANMNLESMKKNIGRLLAEALYLEHPMLDHEKSFAEIGVDSIIGVEFVKSLSRFYHIDIAATVLYECPTVNLLAALVCEKASDQANAGGGAIRDSQGSDSTGVLGARTSLPVLTSASNGEDLVRLQPDSAPRNTGRCASRSGDESIAIVGASCRLPGAITLEEFWNNLEAGVNSVVEVPKERWDPEDYYDADGTTPGKVNAKWLGAISDVDKFDAQFFGISPAEAECMDPQQRVFLQEAWKSLEDAGYCRSNLSERKVGTYVGVIGSEYGALMFQTPHYANNPHAMTGNSNAIFAARLAYFLNLKGPAIAIDTACSSSLVSLHLACRSLIGREIDMAVVGGVSLYLTVTGFIQMSKAGMLSTEGKCFAFDSRANGIVPADGVVVVVLKRLDDAIADRDHIYGSIIGSGINQDGRTNGITAPSLNSQAELHHGVYEQFGIDPATISYVEAHGTGTKLGDPIEIQALTRVFRKYSDKRRYCAIGSVKSNIGHASAAAGLAGVLKVLLSLNRKQLPPAINFAKASEYIDWETSPFYVNTKLCRWDVEGNLPRRAAVNSFGYSGTNAHVVIEEFDVATADTAFVPDSSPSFLVPLSARTPESLKIQAENLLAHLVKCAMQRWSDEKEAADLGNVAYTLQVGREPMKHRIAFVVSGNDDLRRKLSSYIAGEGPIGGCFRGSVPEGDQDIVSYLYGSQKLRKAIQDLLCEANLSELAELWCKGCELNWNLLTNARSPRRVSLPTYPFANKSFWFDRSMISLDPTLKSSQQPQDMQARDHWNKEPNLAECNAKSASRVKLDNVAELARPEGPLFSANINIKKMHFGPESRRTDDKTEVAHGIPEITQILARQLARVLCIEETELGTNEKFLDMGLDSILGVEWLREINGVFKINIAAPRLYDNSTIASLAEFIEREISGSPADHKNESHTPIIGVHVDAFSESDLGPILDRLANGEMSVESALNVVNLRFLSKS